MRHHEEPGEEFGPSGFAFLADGSWLLANRGTGELFRFESETVAVAAGSAERHVQREENTMPDEDDNTKSTQVPSTPLHAYKEGRKDEVSGDADALESNDPAQHSKTSWKVTTSPPWLLRRSER